MRFYCTAALLLNLALPAHSATLFVSKTGDGTNGLTWPTAFQEIGAAITASSTGDEIWVATGTYDENIVIDAPLAILGGFSGTERSEERNLRDPEAFPTVIDGNRQESVVVAESDAIIDGITIQNGKASVGSGLRGIGSNVRLNDVKVISNGMDNSGTGGGIYQNGGSLEINDSMVSFNFAGGRGGGLYAIASTVWIEDSEFQGNSSITLGSGVYVDGVEATIINSRFFRNGFLDGKKHGGRGGGVRVIRSQVSILNSLFEENYATGLSIASASATVRKCTFRKNDGGGKGGGIHAIVDSHFYVNRCLFKENINSLPPPPNFLINEGGAMFSQASTGVVSNSLFIKNESRAGSEIRLRDTPSDGVELVNNTFDIVGSIVTGDIAISWEGTGPVVKNCIIAGHGHDIFQNDDFSITYSNIEGGFPGEGNIDSAPMFVDPDHGDYRLMRGSPCIEAGTDTGLTEDFDGNPRPVGDYDMGAFEYPLLRSDLNLDGRVDDTDLRILSRDWKKVSGP